MKLEIIPTVAGFGYSSGILAHDPNLAEGLPAETYLDAGDRATFSGGDVIALYPDFGARRWEMHGCAALVLTGPALEAVRRRLAERAADMAALAAAA